MACGCSSWLGVFCCCPSTRWQLEACHVQATAFLETAATAGHSAGMATLERARHMRSFFTMMVTTLAARHLQHMPIDRLAAVHTVTMVTFLACMQLPKLLGQLRLLVADYESTCAAAGDKLRVQTGNHLFLGMLQGHKASGRSGSRWSEPSPRDQTATASSSGRAPLPAQQSSSHQQQQKKSKSKKKRGRRH